MNPNIEYFSLLEYINKIELENFVLDHIEETTKEITLKSIKEVSIKEPITTI